MNNDEFKEMYLLFRQKNMTLIDIRIMYGVDKANEFEKEMISRTEAINQDNNDLAKKYGVDIDKEGLEKLSKEFKERYTGPLKADSKTIG